MAQRSAGLWCRLADLLLSWQVHRILAKYQRKANMAPDQYTSAAWFVVVTFFSAGVVPALFLAAQATDCRQCGYSGTSATLERQRFQRTDTNKTAFYPIIVWLYCSRIMSVLSDVHIATAVIV